MTLMNRAAVLIANARRAAGLSQAELARRAGTSQPAVALYESGAKAPNAATLERLLRAAGAELQVVSVPGRRRPRGSLRQLLLEHREAILAAAARHHASNVCIFGSVARGQERGGSDVDLLVDFDLGCSLLDQVRLRRELTHLLGVEVDVVSARGLLESDQHIRDEAVAI
ncbi:MAG: helix-turn-helix domain-containing protein [Actinomycetota bacterium]